jgi:phage-related protein
LSGIKKIFAEFFRTEAGREPVRDALRELGRPASTDIGADIRFVEEHWKLDRPYVDRIRSGKKETERTIYEVRHTLEKREFRTLFFVYTNRMVLVHFIEKKRRKTPQDATELAWKRMKQWMIIERKAK